MLHQAALLLAACGSDSEEAAPAESDPATEAAATTTTTTPADPVEIELASERFVTDSNRVEISGRVRPAAASLLVDGAAVSVDERGRFTVRVRAPQRGGDERLVELFASAAGYERAAVSVVVRRKRTPEQIAAAKERAAEREALRRVEAALRRLDQTVRALDRASLSGSGRRFQESLLRQQEALREAETAIAEHLGLVYDPHVGSDDLHAYAFEDCEALIIAPNREEVSGYKTVSPVALNPSRRIGIAWDLTINDRSCGPRLKQLLKAIP